MSTDIQDLIPDAWEGDLYVVMNLQRYGFGQIGVHDIDFSKNDTNYALLHTVKDLRLDIPHKIDVRAAAVRGLTKEKENILAKAHVKANAVQDKIDALLQITHEPQPSETPHE